MDEVDYPAAHSMDTAFFAVDRDGHVACFESGPSGAVPMTGEVELGELHEVWRQRREGVRPYWEALLEQLALLLPHCEARHELAGHRPPDLFGQPPQHADPAAMSVVAPIYDRLLQVQRHAPGPGVAHILLFLKSLDPALQAEIAAGRGAELPAVGAVAVQALGLSPDLVRRLHDEGQCLGCYYRYLPSWAAVPGSPIRSAQSSWTLRLDIPSTSAAVPGSPATFGLFWYTPSLDNWMAAPYGRLEVPVRPVHIDQLRPAFHQQFRRLQLDFSFAERAYVQPVEHWPCTSCEPAFLSSDGRKIGRVRDVAGEQHWYQSYAEFYAYLKDRGESWLRAVEIEPPAGTD
jgi:hypothetical protein